MTVQIGKQSFAIALPTEHELADTIAGEVVMVIDAASRLAINVHDFAVTAAAEDLQHGLTRLRALGALADNGEVEERHRLDSPSGFLPVATESR